MLNKKIYNLYKIINSKVIEPNAAIWFNKTCRNKQLGPQIYPSQGQLQTAHKAKRTTI
jgi:hypothetical protein